MVIPAIPADQFLLDGDTAWWVVSETEAKLGIPALFDRPCETCGDLLGHGGFMTACCGATGRHTFDIEVEYPDISGRFIESKCTYRVSIVPGMVLAIGDRNTRGQGFLYRQTDIARSWIIVGGGPQVPIDALPPAAAPGMWAVKLRVAS